MKKANHRRPAPTEYGAYYHTYVSKVEQDDIVKALADAAREGGLEF